MKRLLSLFLIMLMMSGYADAFPFGGGGTPVPAAARSVGYLNRTFSMDRNFSTTTVDMGCTRSSGFLMYIWNFFSRPCSSANITLNADGTAGLYQPFINGTLVSAAQTASAPFFVGKAFGGGGYFEADISFNPFTTVGGGTWPAWWLMTLEHLAGLDGQQWLPSPTPNPSGYDHFLEADIFEYDRGKLNQYGGTLHDWYGFYNITCLNLGYCVVDSNFNSSTVTVPTGTDWTIYHHVGLLWVPATSIANGYYSFWFDDQQIGPTFYFSQFTTQQPIPTTSTTWTFGVGDQQHFVLILGDMNVKAVRVWQLPSASCSTVNLCN